MASDGIWKIVAHIEFKFYSVASGSFSTGSTNAADDPPPPNCILSDSLQTARGRGSRAWDG